MLFWAVYAQELVHDAQELVQYAPSAGLANYFDYFDLILRFIVTNDLKGGFNYGRKGLRNPGSLDPGGLPGMCEVKER